MKPVKSPPNLFTLNGCGVTMYGRRNPDPATGTYIKTRCLCLIFIPILPLDAYRVADAQSGGWYFLGREPVSGLARGMRWCVLLLLAALIGSGAWKSHVNSPEYLAQRAREQAAALAAGGQALQAADVYRELLREGIGNPIEWRDAMAALLRTEISSGDAKRSAAAVRYADEKKIVPGSRDALVPDLADQALAAAAKSGDPAAVESILSSFKPAPTDLTRVHEALRKALESLHQAQPDDREVRIRLALIREEFGEVEGALGLLEPAADQLADGEGARLFGHLLLGEGRTAEALPHLERYVTPRLTEWKSAETGFERAYETAQKKALDDLNQSGGPPGFKRRYEAANEAEKQRMVDEQLSLKVRFDQSFLEAQDRYQTATRIVPAIMDLGVARLRMAQAEADPAARQGLLKSAEEAFLSLKSVAGESDEFRLFLGQIYFWSGRESEGRKLFDELLAAKKRDYATLYGLADIFRDLGEDNDARKLLEEALSKASNDHEKSSAIGLRSLLARSTDEKIEWLAKGNSSPLLAISLSEARGAKAEETGDLEAAKRHYREALAGYGKQARASTNLNNSALLYRALYRIDGKQADFETAARLFSEAVELEPANSILSSNASESLLTAAALRVAGDQVHPKLLQFDGGIDSLRFLYQREEEKEKLVAQLKADPNFRKSISHYWDALLLAPKSASLYGWGAAVFAYVGDDESLEKLLSKAAEQEFDFTAQREDLARHLKKERDGEIRDGLKAQRDRVKELVGALDDRRSRAMAQSAVAAVRLAGFAIGEPCEGSEWITQLKSAAKEVPCSRLQTTLEGALEILALEKLHQELPDCASIIDANRRLLGPGDLLRLLVRAKGDLGEQVRKHPAVIEARETASRTEQLFPSSFALDDWLLLDGLHPASDPMLKQLAAANRADRLVSQLTRQIQYEGPSALLEQFWMKTFEGDTQGAQALVPQVEAAGVKMPPMF